MDCDQSTDSTLFHDDLDVGANEISCYSNSETHVKRRRGQWCSAINCTNGRYNRPDLSFFRFPKDEERCRKWVINSRRQDLLTKSSKTLFSGNVLCSKHFEDSQFANASKTKLKIQKAIPTLFDVPNPPPKLAAKRLPPKDRKSLEIPSSSSKGEPVSQDLALSHETPDKQDRNLEKIALLRKKIKRQQIIIKRLQVKNKSLPTGLSAQKDLSLIKKLTAKYLPRDAHDFVSKQLAISQMKGKRWRAKDKSQALSLYHASPKAYRLLRKQFSLPSVSTLRRTMRNIDIQPGFPQIISDAFSIKVSNMTQRDRQCILVFDEIALKSNLRYNVEGDFVEGFEDFGPFGKRTDKEADHATVFMARGLFAKWKQPIGYFLSQSTMRPQILQDLTLQAIGKLKSIGLTVKAVLCDQGSNNCAVFRRLNVSSERPFFQYHQEDILVIFDPPHLLKNIRNNLLKYDFFIDDTVVSWRVIREFYEKDKTFPLRMAPKLTHKHIDLPAFSSLRVSLAAQILSHSVAAAIAFLCQVGVFPAEYMATSQFLEHFDSLFNTFNITGGKSSAPYKHKLTPSSSHIPFLKKTIGWLQSMKYGKESKKAPAENLPCIRGWIQTIRALLMLLEGCTSEDVTFLLTNRLNQDCLENLFSTIRGKGGHRDNPDPYEFRIAFRQVMVDKILLSNAGSNCKDDIDTFLLNLTADKNASSASMAVSWTNNPTQKQIQTVNLIKSMRMEDLLQLENVIGYISGYILKKIPPSICGQCRHLLEESNDTKARHLALINTKQYAECKNGGLSKPSFQLVEAIGLYEAMFQTEVQTNLSREKLGESFKFKLLELPCSQRLRGPECSCRTPDFVTNLYFTLRVHHELTLRNTTPKMKAHKRVRKLDKLRHV